MDDKPAEFDEFTMELHHGGVLVQKQGKSNGKVYVNGDTHQFHYLKFDGFCLQSLVDLMNLLGYRNFLLFKYKKTGMNLNMWLNVICSKADVKSMIAIVKETGFIECYVEGGVRINPFMGASQIHEEVQHSLLDGMPGDDTEDEDYNASQEEVDSDVASLDHLSDDEDELREVRENRIAMKKKKGKQQSSKMRGTFDVGANMLTEYRPTCDDDYDTGHDSSDYDSPVEGEEGQYLRVKGNYEVYDNRVDMYKFEPSYGMLFASASEFKSAMRDYSVGQRRGERSSMMKEVKGGIK